ncbi:hypothetical protein [Propionicimonas sp.]|uniref:hypothetical protein n=1 Tax=Propionicimonas sp. TaxID=1955623 RepID=UPI0039E4E938
MIPHSRRAQAGPPLGPVERWRSERDRARAPGNSHLPWCHGHGWMLDAGVVDVLAPVLLTQTSGDDSYYRLTLVGARIAARLLELLPQDYLASQRQNDGPTIGTVLRAVVAHPDDLFAHGYVIGPSRCDERITVEGVLFRAGGRYRLCPPGGPELDGCDCAELYARLSGEFGVDDADAFPDELSLRDGPGPDPAAPSEGTWWYRAWWD